MSDLIELEVKCGVCDRPAIQALTIEVTFTGKALEMSIPLCSSCRPNRVANIQITNLPTHQPIELARVKKFPPGRGEFFGDPVTTFGCPKCGNGCSLGTTLQVVGKKITPSFICPHGCGLHTWLSLDSTRKVTDA